VTDWTTTSRRWQTPAVSNPLKYKDSTVSWKQTPPHYRWNASLKFYLYSYN